MAETSALRLRPRGTCNEEISEQGVFIEIVSRLPVKSICSFKTVCKNWCGFISGKDFAKKQLAVSRQNPTFISCPVMDASMKFYSMKPDGFELCTLNTINPAQRSPENCMKMVASFNGLVCCTNQISDEDVENEFCDLQIWICNPCTGETLLLPQGTPSLEVEPSIGVAYDSDTSDYKVFRIFAVGEDIPETNVSMDYPAYDSDTSDTTDGYASGYECEVYSSSTGSWKNVGPVPCAPRPSWLGPSKSSHVFVDGKIFWLSSLDGKGKVLSVDLEGRVSVFGLPRYPDNSSDEEEVSITGSTFLINLQGVLAAVIIPSEYLMDIWVRNEEAVNGWELLHDAYTQFVDGEIVLTMTSLNNKILCVTETDWWSYDVITEIWESRRGPPSRFLNPSVFPFTESVLTCNGGVMLKIVVLERLCVSPLKYFDIGLGFVFFC